MKTMSLLGVLAAIFTVVICHPSHLNRTEHYNQAGAASSHFQVFRNETNTTSSEIESETEDSDLSIFGFRLPQVFRLFLNDTTNSTKADDEVSSDDEGFDISIFESSEPHFFHLFTNDSTSPRRVADLMPSVDNDAVEGVGYTVDSDYSDYDDNKGDESLSVAKVDNSSAIFNFGDKINSTNISSNETIGLSDTAYTSVSPSIVHLNTSPTEIALTGNKSETTTGEVERNVSDVLYRSRIPTFNFTTGLPDKADANIQGDHQIKNGSFTEKSRNDSIFSADRYNSTYPSASNDENSTVFGSNSSLHSGFVPSSFGDILGAISPDSVSYHGASFGDRIVPRTHDSDTFGDSSSGLSSSAEGAPLRNSSQGFSSEHPSSPGKLGVGALSGFSSENFTSEVQDSRSGVTSLSSSGANGDSAGYSSVSEKVGGSSIQGGSPSDYEDDDEDSVEKRSVSEFDRDHEEPKSSTDITIIASVSSSVGNYNRKIYESVNTNLSGHSFPSSFSLSFPSSPNTEYDLAPQDLGSDATSGPSFSGPDAEKAESTTQAAYDEEAVLAKRQLIAELKRKFLENQSKGNTDEEGKIATDFSDDQTTEKPAVPLLSEAHGL